MIPEPGQTRFSMAARLACLAVCLVGSFSCFASRPADFQARLELSRNGKPFGEATFRLTTEDDRWNMASETRGTRGLARFLGLKEHSRSEGIWVEGAPRPTQYEREVQAVLTMHWSAEFDWASGEVHSVYPDGEATLALEPGTLDESAIGLVIRAGLRRGETEWQLRLLDEEKIESAQFRARDAEQIQTALGCMTVYNVEKVRGARSTRYTRTFYAQDHDYVPVLLQHGKEGGDHIEGRVVELRVDGQVVAAGRDCPVPGS
jgi:hypothetical protein